MRRTRTVVVVVVSLSLDGGRYGLLFPHRNDMLEARTESTASRVVLGAGLG